MIRRLADRFAIWKLLLSITILAASIWLGWLRPEGPPTVFGWMFVSGYLFGWCGRSWGLKKPVDCDGGGAT